MLKLNNVGIALFLMQQDPESKRLKTAAPVPDRPLYVPRYADVGAKLDAYLQQKSQPGQPAQINKRTALQRYHWKMSPLQSLVNRLQLVGVSFGNTPYKCQCSQKQLQRNTQVRAS